MDHRLIEVRVPQARASGIRARVEDADEGYYEQPIGESGALFRLVIPAAKVEELMDQLEASMGTERTLRAVVLPVASMLPRPEEKEPEPKSEEEPEEKSSRISRGELYAALRDGASVTGPFLTMVVLSTIVAAIGLSRNSPAVVIGAMVIAPLLGPNMALALATTLGDTKLAVRTLIANAAGFTTAIVMACLAGLVWELRLADAEILGRTSVTLGELTLALASGAAGALAVARGTASSLVGVMVAVSLLPPLVIASMLTVQGAHEAGMRAGLLVVANVVCLNLAAVSVFRVLGIQPRAWRDVKRARTSTRLALGVWLALFVVVAWLILRAGVAAQ